MLSDRSDELDRLTAAYTRASFCEQLHRLVQQCRRGRAPLALIWVDVDEALELADMHGRARVDGALEWLAGAVSEVSDGRGPIGRVGEDELALALPGVSQGVALKLAEELREAVSRKRHAGGIRVTVSVGVAALRPSEPAGNLLDAAESACQRAKQSGRNAVVGR
jgi:diguanylate cyclase (GGDEF)-like protein